MKRRESKTEMQHYRFALSVLFILITTTALQAEPLCKNSKGPRHLCQKAWTVLIYMNADNDLHPFVWQDLAEMQSVGSSASVDFVVQLDLFNDAGRYRFTIDKNNLPTKLLLKQTAAGEEVDSGNIGTFRDFIEWGAVHYPSEHTMVLVWSHGRGYAGGISPDETSQSQLSIDALQEGLKNLKTWALHGKGIDIYASDACLMQSIEVIYALHTHARFIIGSANIEQTTGWPYNTIFRDLVRHPYASNYSQAGGVGIDAVHRFAAKIPELYIRHYQHDEDATMNAIAGSEIDNALNIGLPHAWKQLSKSLYAFIGDDLFSRPLLIQRAMHATPMFAHASRDVQYFLATLDFELKQMTPAPGNLETLRKAIEDCRRVIAAIIHKQGIHRKGRNFEGLPFSGLTVWLPENVGEYQKSRAAYEKSTFIQITEWDTLLQKIYTF